MILTLFLVFVFLATFLVVLGAWTREGVLSIVGYAFFFILSIILMNGTLQYESGSYKVVHAPCDNNCTEVREGSSTFLALVTTENVTYSYSNADDSTTLWVGRWLAIISALMLVLSLIEGSKTWRGRKEDG